MWREVSGHFVDFFLKYSTIRGLRASSALSLASTPSDFPHTTAGRRRTGRSAPRGNFLALPMTMACSTIGIARIRFSIGCGAMYCAQAGLDQVFLAVGDAYVAVGVDRPDVAGVKPDAVRPLQDPLGLLGHLIIALHDVVALNQQFSVFGDTDFDPGIGRPIVPMRLASGRLNETTGEVRSNRSPAGS